MGRKVALQWSESGLAASLAFVSRPFTAPDQIFNVDLDDDEPYDSDNIVDYRIEPTEQGATGRYLIDLPVAAGYREITVYEVAGAELAESDMPNVIGQGVVYDDGTDVLPAAPASGGGGSGGGGSGATPEEFWTYGNRTLSGAVAGVSVVGPVLSSKKIRLVRGDDYLAADGRALLFTLAGVPSLIGATVVFSLRDLVLQETVINRTPVDVLSATTLQVELTHAQTELLTPRAAEFAEFDIEVTQQSGHVFTPTKGSCEIVGDVSLPPA